MGKHFLSNVPVVFGIRWDEEADGAPFFAKVGDTRGYYDNQVKGKTYPAAAIAMELADIGERSGVFAVMFHDDDETMFGSIVVSDGDITPSSELVFSEKTEWEDHILACLEDGNIDGVYAPDTLSGEDEKLKFYSREDRFKPKKTKKLQKNVGLIAVFGFLGALTVAGLAAVGTYYWVEVGSKVKEEPTQYITQLSKDSQEAFLTSCAEDLKTPWPVAPEWDLVEEGCVGDPNMARLNFSKPVSPSPYSYRVYALSNTQWDTYLSRQSFFQVAKNFPGTLIDNQNQIVLYVPYSIETEFLPQDYVAGTDPSLDIERALAGSVTMNSAPGTAQGVSEIDLSELVERIKYVKMTPISISRRVREGRTEFDIHAERVISRNVPVTVTESVTYVEN